MLENVKAEIHQLRVSLDILQQQLENAKAENGNTINFDIIIDDVHQLTLQDILARIFTSIKIAESTKEDSKNSILPRHVINSLLKSMRDAKKEADIIINNFKKANTDGNITDISNDNISITDSKGEIFTVKQSMQDISMKCDEMLYLSLNIQKLMGSKGYANLSDIFNAIFQDNQKISEERQNAENLLAEITALKTNADSDAKLIKQNAQSIKAIFDKAEADGKLIDADIVTTQDRVTKITEITKEYETLKNNVAAYEAEFKSFDETLKTRNTSYNAARKDLDDAIKFINDSKDVIKNNIEESEKLLTGSTNSALASQIKIQLEKLNKDLNWSLVVVYISNAVLIGIAYYIVDYIFDKNTIASLETMIFIKNLIVRSLLIPPAVYFVWFANRRYTNLFKLKEHYAYKYAIASSVEGFKKQAVGYENEIAMYAFYELGFNPAHEINTKLDSKDQKNSGIRDLINKIILKNQSKAISKIADVTKVANQHSE